MLQQQRDGDERYHFYRGRNVTITPREIPRPISVARVKADVTEQENERRHRVGSDFESKAPPQKREEQERKHQEWIEKEDRLLGLEQRAHNTFVKGRAPGKVRGQGWILQTRFAREDGEIGPSQRSETIETIETLDDRKEGIDWHRNLAISQQALPERTAADMLEPKGREQEEGACRQIEACRHAR